MSPHKNPDSQEIRDMFDRLARRYNLFNSFTILGLDTFWRHETMRSLRPGMRVLDVGCGTGDLSLLAAKKLAGSGEVVALDFSEAMLEVARRRSQELGRDKSRPYTGPRFILKKAEELPLNGNRFDLLVSGFVLRSLYQNIDSILDGFYASLAPGGRISLLDMTQPRSIFWRAFMKFYFSTLVVLYGRLLFGRDYPAFYLTESAAWFLKPEEFVKKLEEKGFEQIRVKKYMFGVIVLYQARRPGAAQV